MGFLSSTMGTLSFIPLGLFIMAVLPIIIIAKKLIYNKLVLVSIFFNQFFQYHTIDNFKQALLPIYL